jgi:preprotein translocase subunit SecD
MSTKKNTGYLALVALGAIVGGFLFYKADSYWGVVASSLIFILTLISMLPVMDGVWRFKVGFVFCTFLLAVLILLPTIEGATGGKVKCPAYIKDHMSFAIAEGLDLQGGMRLVYTVEVEEAIRDKRDHFADEMRQELATVFQVHSGEGLLTRDEAAKLEAKVHVFTPESALIRIKFKDPADASKIDERFDKKFLTELSEQRGPGPGEVSYKIRTEVESQIRERAVNQAKDTVNRRVDELGLREANVTTRDEDIIVEVPGENEKTFNDIKEIIRRTARLEFKMVDDPADFFGHIKDEELPEGEGISIYQENAPDGPGKSVLSHYARIVKKDTETIAECRDRMKKWVATLTVPDDHQIGYEKVTEFDPDTQKSTEIGWRTFYLFARAEVTGDYITDATVAQDTQSGAGVGNFYVAVTFSPAGADRFEEVTGANVQRRFAIILDDEIDSAPVIRTKIGGGRASITLGAGDPEQQLQQARQLELVLRSGALPAPINPSNESLIGPSLGRDAIHEGVKGMMVGSGLVLLFMMFYYRKSGVVADIAVLFNLLMQMAVLASFSATMTLPGIAGLALTIGMSVDVNVLVNERIREELRAGRSIRAAVEAGYGKAFPSILDGHVTVFISGLILAQYGTGPVKGFAVTLIVGIVCSLFTGVFCTRLVFDWWVRHAKVKRLSVGAEF